jgi:hypothetical protein
VAFAPNGSIAYVVNDVSSPRDVTVIGLDTTFPNNPPVAIARDPAEGPYEGIARDVLTDIDPDTLNINSNGKWVTAYLMPDPESMATVQLDGTDSYDPDGDSLTYAWTVLDGDTVVNTAIGPQPKVDLPVGIYDIKLIVNDGKLNSEPDDSLIIVIPMDLTSVDPTEITLCGPAANAPVPGEWGEMINADTMMVKFSRSDLIFTLIPNEPNVIMVGGPVNGEDTIMVIDRGGGKKSK